MIPMAIPKGRADSVMERVLAVVRSLPIDKGWRVEVHEQKGTRSEQQNRYLWGVCYPTILTAPGMEGWEAKDVHEYFLGEHFGWDRVDMFGKTRLRPMRRSSKLSKLEFAEYVEFIQRSMADRGIYIEDPR